MSYNCDTWKTKKLDNLRIPVKSLFKHDRVDWHPIRINHDDASVEYRILEGTFILGKIENDEIVVSEIKCCGEGSGTAMNYIIEPALKDSTGTLIASCVWECGDTINRITVLNGTLVWEDIEI